MHNTPVLPDDAHKHHCVVSCQTL